MDRFGVRWLWDKDGGGGSGGAGGDDKAAADKAAADKAAADAKGKGDDDKAPVPYARFAQVVHERSEFERRLTELETAQAKAKETDLAGQKKFETLWGEEKAAHAKTQEAVKAATAKALRLEVSQAKGLPVELAARLQGDTKEALEADADVLLAAVGVEHKEGPGVPPRGPKGGPKVFNLDTMTPKEIRDNTAQIMAQTSAPQR